MERGVAPPNKAPLAGVVGNVHGRGVEPQMAVNRRAHKNVSHRRLLTYLKLNTTHDTRNRRLENGN
jgi:hypothetical protein